MPKRPNILFIHVDQMHWQAVSAYGNPYIKTPAMELDYMIPADIRAALGFD